MPDNTPNINNEDVTAILVSYNSESIIANTLKSLQKEKRVSTIFVVDNCSHDNSCEMIQRQFSDVQLIENNQNIGFGCGNNIALNKVKTPYVLLINPDAVLQEGALDIMLNAAEQYPEAAILAPQLFDETGQLHQSFKRNVFDREGNRDSTEPASGDLCADFLSGAVLLCKMDVLKTTGFFDPNIFLYYEDDDLCMRVREKGYALVLVHDAHAEHLMGASSAPETSIEKEMAGDFFRQQHMTWSRLYIESKYHGEKSAARLAHKLRLAYSIKSAVYMLLGKKRKFNRYRGRMKGLDNFMDTPKQNRAA